ncbi:penicillin acylase family protein [Marinobacter halophilus]|uniref:Acyl-homoserine-lactone acylase n=1 Tax=Marinobacter halophilus TaxID=1323740 RepID=A0A2T1KGS2_9GAMM|nr:penicillin acylase family protein [Marinobacter halophilus]PSF08953.1 acyl-homoserine-lactone acylase [Marinobacter halophilus]
MRSLTVISLLCPLLLVGCNGGSGGSSSSTELEQNPAYQVDIRYTEFGVPHITANDYGSLGYGAGYDHARNNLCTLSEQLVKLKSQKSRYFGPGEGSKNILTDVGYKALDYPAQAVELFDQLSPTSTELLQGYAAGFNRSLAERQGPQDYPSPCRGAEWVEPISAEDLLAYQLDLAGLASARNFISAIAAAQPPGASMASLDVQLDAAKVFTSEGIGSNGWALGEDKVEDGTKSLLLGNPHFPWDGELRFYQNHLTIPGELNVNGVTMIGLPAVVIGFNDDLGWIHTVSQSKRFTFYQLTLDPSDPTRYQYDVGGQTEFRNMSSKTVQIQVKQADGSLADYSQPVYFSHHGPVVNLASLSPALGWTADTAIAFRDANAGNTRMLDQWLAMGKADSREAFFSAFEENQGIPWVNTLMIDKEGTANYIDGTQVPNLGLMAEGYWRQASQSPLLAPIWQDGAGSVLLPGDDARYEWIDTGETKTPGVVPFAKAPKQTRRDYVFNANSSHWLSNLEEPLEGSSIMYGPEGTIRSTRTRYNAQLISDNSNSGLAGADGRFSLEELKTVMTHNGSLFGGEWKTQLTSRCTDYPAVDYEGEIFNLGEACQTLSNWDGRYNTDSKGAHLMREFLAAFRVSGHRELSDDLFSTAFDPAAPVTTPSGLSPIDTANANTDPVLRALAAAADRLNKAGIELGAPLGSVQYVLKAEGEQPIAISGGYSFEGMFNMAETKASSRSTSDLANALTGSPVDGSSLFALDENGDGSDELAYRINYGSSFVMALEYTDNGPKAEMFLSYSQGHDPQSENFKDQTELYSNLQWRPMLFDEGDIADAVVEAITLQE